MGAGAAQRLAAEDSSTGAVRSSAAANALEKCLREGSMTLEKRAQGKAGHRRQGGGDAS